MLYMLREEGKSMSEVERWFSDNAPTTSADMIDLHQAHIHRSPSDVADWPITAVIKTITMRPRGALDGLGFTFEPALPDKWKFFTNPGVNSDNFQYTVWAVVRVAGVWHAGAFIQMWADRPNTGAPILAQWKHDWVEGDRTDPTQRRPWGDEMADYMPAPGDPIAFFVSAGNARMQGGPTTVRERSNVVTLSLPAGDSGTFSF
jgi:hypothetical protein